MSIPTAPFGKNGPEVNRMGLGLMGLSVAYGPAKPDNERLALLDAAYEMGERFWDSADSKCPCPTSHSRRITIDMEPVYGDSEELLGKWFKANPDKRDKIFLATKFGVKYNREIGQLAIDSSPEYVKEAFATSLKRLGLPSVDLYYSHRQDRKTPIEKTIEAMAELVKEGKVKYLGISECSANSLRRAHKVHPITAIQVEYSPFALEIESKQIDLLRTCRELGVAVVAYSPLGRGMFTGTIRSPSDFTEDDFRANAPRFSAENFPKNLELVDALNELAKSKGVTSSQLVLAWLLAQGLDIFPIPGTTKEDRLKENLGSLNVELSKEELEKIRKLVDAAEPKGERFPAAFVAYSYVDSPPL
jgi:aryl-alcohol dehydrogenase-like predicted oxidoreductase